MTQQIYILDSFETDYTNVDAADVKLLVDQSEDVVLGYTVPTLPTGTTGQTAYVTDADTISYRATAVGGGSATALVFFDGTNWIYH